MTLHLLGAICWSARFNGGKIGIWQYGGTSAIDQSLNFLEQKGGQGHFNPSKYNF